MVSENVANANTPEYSPKRIESFSEFMSRGGASTVGREWQIENLSNDGSLPQTIFNEQKPNGNSVSVEGEALRSIEIERQHSQALAIYQHSMDLLKVAIGRG